MFQARIDDTLTTVDQVVYVVQGIEVTDGGDAVLLEKFCMKVDHIAGLGVQPDYVDTPGEGL